MTAINGPSDLDPVRARQVSDVGGRFQRERDRQQRQADLMWLGAMAAMFSDHELRLLDDLGSLCQNDRDLLRQAGPVHAEGGREVKTATVLAPVDKTRMLRRRTRSGETRPECWGARTKDKVWDFTREDEPGTPWTVKHRPTGTVVDCYVGTLTDCRAYVASGQAEADLDRIQSHERGGHETERDRTCPRC